MENYMIPTKVLIEAAKNYKITDEDIEKLKKRLEESRLETEDQERRSSSQEFMNRSYNL